MDDRTGHGDDSQTREERLAAKLRENLRRRKAQARALAGRGEDNEPVRLSKSPPES
ncbi:hypothetical protein [Novosphingobium sp.]|uniref:hypothetical protein n=1 Tax=Novosphingobium sp. TaxID=1874826 RepID=UPI002B49DC8B|nr:hypothetical protein [Novosphingobium sp.]HKR91999.1 hypothetical protein [Novosphingobium sp.]